MLNKSWVKSEISKILELDDISNIETDLLLSELLKHSLKLVTFLAKFNYEYKVHPSIIDFIQNPTMECLEKSIATKI